MNYETFLSSKSRLQPDRGFKTTNINPMLFDWQAAIVDLACRRGSFGGFEDCGLGKSPQQLECAAQFVRNRHKRVLILCPLAVSHQLVREAEKFGINCDYAIAKSQADVCSGITISNYERMEKFDPKSFDGIVLDEGSILKSVDGKTRNALLDAFQHCEFKQSWTATPAPNDHMEIGNQSEFLGAMKRMEMLSTYFVHDGGDTAKWRLKGHAKHRFWEWMASWSVVLRSPADIGYDGSEFQLPELIVNNHEIGGGGLDGFLFDMPARTMSERREAAKSTIQERCEFAAKQANESKDAWVIWCNRNAEGELLSKLIPDAYEVAGRHSVEQKEETLAAFSAGEIRVLITKPKIGGFGLNWQHCSRTAVFPTDSWEQWYQMIRRFWRFGQQRPVHVDVIYSTGEAAIAENLRRKEQDSVELISSMAAHMRHLMTANVRGVTANIADYNPEQEMEIPRWLRSASTRRKPTPMQSTTAIVAK